jgi:hypothetical protein
MNDLLGRIGEEWLWAIQIIFLVGLIKITTISEESVFVPRYEVGAFFIGDFGLRLNVFQFKEYRHNQNCLKFYSDCRKPPAHRPVM